MTRASTELADLEPWLWLGLAMWLMRDYTSDVVPALEDAGASLYEKTHPTERGHQNDLSEHQISRPALLDLATRAGFADPQVAVAIAYAESRGFPQEIADTPYEYSIGLWQINVKAHKQYDTLRGRAWLLDPGYNAQAAYKISKGGTDWRPWSTWWADPKRRKGPGEGRYLLFLHKEPGAPATDSRVVQLGPGIRYQATLQLQGIEQYASNDQVLASIQEQVGPWRNARVTGEGSKRYATGVYAGAARKVRLPEQVVSFKGG